MISHKFIIEIESLYALAPYYYDFALGCGVILAYRLIDEHIKEKSFYKKHKEDKKNDYRPH